MKLKLLNIVIVLIFTNSCSTQTKTEKLNAGLQDTAALAGTLISGQPPAVVPYLNSSTINTSQMLAISGFIKCDSNPIFDFGKLQIEVKFNNRTTGVYDLDQNGTYKIKTKSFIGSHQINLISKATSQIIEQKTVTSSQDIDTFTLNFNACK
ncbi:MAG: hypothetical protein ACK4VO_02745 [Pseudobdellovibrio sp.]